MKKRTIKNKAVRDKMKLLVKRTRKSIEAGKLDEAKDYIVKAQKSLDKAAKVGVIKKNASSRTKSRLSKALNKATK